MDMVVALGARNVRLDLYWRDVETSVGIYNWTRSDRVFNAAKSRGLTVLWILHRTPSWARSGGTDLTYPTNASAYANFAATAAKRYPGCAWEMWNEPNGSWAASDVTATGQAKLAAMIVAAAPAIRTADPTAKVIGPGILRGGAAGSTSYVLDVNYLSGLYDNGLVQANLDALGFHAYSFPWDPFYVSADVNQGWNRIAPMRAVAVARGDNKPLWLTEQGQQTGGALAVDEATQATFVTHAHQRFVQERDAGRVSGPFFWYSHRDAGTIPYASREYAFGLARNDRSHKPAWAAYQTSVSGF